MISYKKQHEGFAKTVAHELGHGLFRLFHTFSTENKYKISEPTDNLMLNESGCLRVTAKQTPMDELVPISSGNYNGGTALYKYQWDLIHDPEKIWFAWLEEEGEGALMSPSLIGEGIFFYPLAEIKGITGMSNCSKGGDNIEIGKYVINPHYWKTTRNEKLVFYLAAKEEKNYRFDWVIMPKSLDKFRNEETIDRKLINDTYSDLADRAYNLLERYPELADDFLKLWNANTTIEQFDATLNLSIQNIKRCWTDPFILISCATGTIVAYEAYLAKISAGTISSLVAENGIKTPYGVARQTYTPSALDAIDKVKSGAKLYRVGKLSQSQTAEGQFWSLENPATIKDINVFAQKYGIPVENLKSGNYFIEVGTLKDNTMFITREAPGVGSNLGGAIEVVTPSGNVILETFHTVTF